MLEGLKPKSSDKLCGLITKAQNELSKEDQRILFDAVADTEQWTSHALAMELRGRGFHVHRAAVGDHRSGRCACAK